VTIGHTHSGYEYRDTILEWKAARSGAMYKKNLYLDLVEGCTEECVSSILKRESFLDGIGEVTEWSSFTLTNEAGMPRFRRHPTRKMRKEGFVLYGKKVGHDIEFAMFPLQNPIVASPRPRIASHEVDEIKSELLQNIKGFESAISEAKLKDLKSRIDRMSIDWQQALLDNPGTHRRRAQTGRRTGELRLLVQDYHPTVQKAIKAGMVIKFEEDGLPRIVETTPIPDEEWGFNASVIKRAAHQYRRFRHTNKKHWTISQSSKPISRKILRKAGYAADQLLGLDIYRSELFLAQWNPRNKLGW